MNASANDPALEADRLTPPARRRWLVWVLMLVVFLSGMAVGGAGALLIARHQLLRLIHHPELAMPEVAHLLGHRLGLSPEQVRRVEEILLAREKRLEAIRREAQPQIDSEFNKLEQEVSGVLDPKQREVWQGLFERLRRTWGPERIEKLP